MPRYEKNKSEELREFLYQSDYNAHDAELESVNYAYENENLAVKLFHPFYHWKMELCFHGVKTFFAIRGNEFGSHKTILGLTVEEDFSYLQKYFPKYGEKAADSLYLVFQMFSGDELHVVSDVVTVETQNRWQT